MRCGKWTRRKKVEIIPRYPSVVALRECSDHTYGSVIQFKPDDGWTASVTLPYGEHPQHRMLAFADEGLTERAARARVDAFLRARQQRR